MAITTTTQFKRVSLTVNWAMSRVRIYARLTDTEYYRWYFSPDYEENPNDANLQAVRDIWASDEGFQDTNGNDLDVAIQGLHADFLGSVADLEKQGLFNPLDPDSYGRWKNLLRINGAFMHGGTVDIDPDTGRHDIHMSGGFVPEKRASDSGEMQQPLEDWTASNVIGRLRVTIYARAGEQFEGTDLISDDPRIEALIQFLDNNRTSGNAINFDGLTLSGLHAALMFRTYIIDQDVSTMTNNIALTLSSSGRNLNTLNLTFNVTSGTLLIGLMNTLLSNISFNLETDEAIEEPPFGSLAVRILAERIEFANGQFISERGIPTWRFDGRSHPMGGSYGKTIRLHNLTLHDDGYHFFPWDDREAVYDLRAVHIEDFFDVVVRLGSYDEMAVGAGSQFSFDIHNANDHGGATVKIEDVDGNDIITLLPQETLSVIVEQFTNSNGEIRSGQRISRPLEVSADGVYATMADVGYWEARSTHWARPIPFPTQPERATELFYAADVFKFGTASISNSSSVTASNFNMHVREAFQLLKANGRLRYHMVAGARASSAAGSIYPNIQLWRQRGGIGNAPEIILPISHTIFEADDEQTWELIFEDEGAHVQEDDIFLPVIEYNKNATRTPANISLISFRLSVYLNQAIVLEYSA